MKSISAAAVFDVRPSLEILREVRATDDVAPDRGASRGRPPAGGTQVGGELGAESEGDADAGL